MRKRRRQGFSLTECLIAVTVLSVALSGLASTLFFGLLSGQYADERSHALNWARQMVEIVKISNADFQNPLPAGLNDAPTVRRALGAAPFDGGLTGSSSGMFADERAKGFTRNIQVKRIGPGGYIAEIRVQIFWTNHGVERSLELVSHHAQL